MQDETESTLNQIKLNIGNSENMEKLRSFRSMESSVITFCQPSWMSTINIKTPMV